MSRFGGQTRHPRTAARIRRDQDKFASAADVFAEDFQTETPLASTGGLVYTGGELTVDLRDANPGLELSATGLGVLVGAGLTPDGSGNLQLDITGDDGLQYVGSGVNAVPGVKLRGTTPGLEVTTAGLGVVLGNGSLTYSGSSPFGLIVGAATEGLRAGVFRQTNIADVGPLTDNSGGASGAGTIAAITDANNTGSADLAATQDAIATLAAYCTDLENKINAMLAAQQAAGQMT